MLCLAETVWKQLTKYTIEAGNNIFEELQI
jgi:hypothetical protein